MAVKLGLENIILRKDILTEFSEKSLVKDVFNQEIEGINKSDKHLIVINFMSTLELNEMLESLTRVGLTIIKNDNGIKKFQDLAVISSGLWGVLEIDLPLTAYPCDWLEINRSDFTVSMKECQK